MDLEALLRELGNQAGLGAVELDEGGGFQIALGDDLIIDIEPAAAGGGFHLSGAVGPLPDDGREAVLAELLEANLLGQGTDGAALAIDLDMDEIVLCRQIDREDMPFADFERVLETFAATLASWRERHGAGAIGSGDAGDTSETGADEDTGPSLADHQIIRG